MTTKTEVPTILEQAKDFGPRELSRLVSEEVDLFFDAIRSQDEEIVNALMETITNRSQAIMKGEDTNDYLLH